MEKIDLLRRQYKQDSNPQTEKRYFYELIRINGYLPAHAMFDAILFWLKQRDLLKEVIFSGCQQVASSLEKDDLNSISSYLEKAPLSPLKLKVNKETSFGVDLLAEDRLYTEELFDYTEQYNWEMFIENLGHHSENINITLSPNYSFLYQSMDRNDKNTGKPVDQERVIDFGLTVLEAFENTLEDVYGGPLSNLGESKYRELIESLRGQKILISSARDDGLKTPLEENWSISIKIKLPDDVVKKGARGTSGRSKLLGSYRDANSRFLNQRFTFHLNASLGRINDKKIAPGFFFTDEEYYTPLGFKSIVIMPDGKDTLFGIFFKPTPQLWFDLL